MCTAAAVQNDNDFQCKLNSNLTGTRSYKGRLTKVILNN